MKHLLPTLALVALVTPLQAQETDFLTEIARWKAARHASLLRPNGWMTLVGLHWLKEGQNAFGSDPDLPVVLEGKEIAPQVGQFRVTEGKVWLTADPKGGLTLRGAPVTGELLVKADVDGTPDVFELGGLAFHVIRRKDRFALRVRNPKHPALATFKGVPTYRPDPAYRIVASFQPFDTPHDIQVPSIVGYTETMQSPGLVTFKLRGKVMTLEPVVEDPEHPELFFIFRDRTSGKGTYGAGRFLYAAMPKDGKVILDFNKAQNPPCAFTPFATCPLPPKQNHLRLAIPAGEKAVGDH